MMIETRNNIKKILIICLLALIQLSVHAQDPNIFYSSPDEMKTYFDKGYAKIEIEIFQNRGRGSERVRMPGKHEMRIVEFAKDGSCIIRDKTKDDIWDTISYTYDKCGRLMRIKGHSIYSHYTNRYKNCQVVSRESNETLIESNGSYHQWNLTRYVYNANKQVKKELIYDFLDTLNVMYANEFAYIGTTKDSMNEFYFEEGAKMKNRSTKYYTSTKLDSIRVYNPEFSVIDKTVYTYHPSGKLKTVNINGLGTFHYSYNPNNEIESIYEEMANKEYLIRFFE